MDEDDFFTELEMSDNELFHERVKELKEIGEEQYMLNCGDERDLDLSVDMFDDKELNRENLLEFGKKFRGKLYQEIYIRDTGHSILIEDLEIYPRGEYNYNENVLYQIDWDKGISLNPDGSHHINWKKVEVHNFKELKEACGLNTFIKSIVDANQAAIAAFGPLTNEKMNAVYEKYGYERFRVDEV